MCLRNSGTECTKGRVFPKSRVIEGFKVIIKIWANIENFGEKKDLGYMLMGLFHLLVFKYTDKTWKIGRRNPLGGSYRN